MAGVNQAPLSSFLPAFAWRGDILGIAISRDGSQPIDLAENDVGLVHAALTWCVLIGQVALILRLNGFYRAFTTGAIAILPFRDCR